MSRVLLGLLLIAAGSRPPGPPEAAVVEAARAPAPREETLINVMPLLAQRIGDDLTLERRTRLVAYDPVDRPREVQRDERLKMQGAKIAIEDLTFGTRFIIRGDKKLVWIADPLAGTYSELTFEQITKRRAEMIAEIVKAKERVAGSDDEKVLANLLAALGEFPSPPRVAVAGNAKADGIAGRVCVGKEVMLDGTIQRLNVLVDPTMKTKYFELMSAIGGYPPAVAQALDQLGGFPLRGTMRYALFMDRVMETFDTTSIKTDAIPEKDFDLPDGLRKIPLAGFEPVAVKKPEKPKDFTRSFKEDDIDRERNPLKETKKEETPK